MSSKHDEKRAAISRRDALKVGIVGMAGIMLPNVRSAFAGAGAPLGFCPIQGFPGDLINLFGPAMGADPVHLSTRIVSGSSMAFCYPLSFNATDLITQITAVPPALLSGDFVVENGMGALSSPANMPAELTLTDPIRSWLGTGDTQHTSFQPFGLPSVGNQPDCLSVWGSLNLGRLGTDLVFPLNVDGCAVCPSGTRLTLRAYGATTGNAFSFEYQATLVTTTPLYPGHVAEALCVMLESTFDTEYMVNMDCSYTVIDDVTVNLSVGAPGGSPFTVGALHVELTHDFGSLSCDSMDDDSMGGDSMGGDSMAPDCPSISVDFMNFVFT